MRVIQISVLFSCLASLCFAKKSTRCNGEELSVDGNEELAKLISRWENKPHCAKVNGSIIIANLTNVRFPIHLYDHLVSIENGSFVFYQNDNVSPAFTFPNLNKIEAVDMAAIVFLKNNKIRFSLGDHFWAVTSNYLATYAIMENKSPVVSVDTYNLMYLAAYPKGRFIIDTHLMVEPCKESVFKPMAGILGVLFVTLLVAFSTVAFYDRNNHQ